MTDGFVSDLICREHKRGPGFLLPFALSERSVSQDADASAPDPRPRSAPNPNLQAQQRYSLPRCMSPRWWAGSKGEAPTVADGLSQGRDVGLQHRASLYVCPMGIPVLEPSARQEPSKRPKGLIMNG